MDPELLQILVCPECRTKVELRREVWLVCPNPQCCRKYPIVKDIPVMLIEEGDKYVDVALDDLDISKVSLDKAGA
jgi:hypothetical protein